MRVAVLYDIHGNLPALEAVLADVEKIGVDRLMIGGDVVPGPMAAECLHAFAELSVPVDAINGNGESAVVSVARGGDPIGVPDAVAPAIRWVAEAQSPAAVDELAGWPLTHALGIEGVGRTLFCHATPRSDTELFTRVTPDERIAPAFADVDLVACGHTHMQFDRTIADLRVVNAGRVGMPFDAPGAWWVLLGPDVEMRRTSYDLDTACARIAATEYPGAASLPLAEPPGEAVMLERYESS